MLTKLRSRLTFANVVSLIALFVALGGSSYAAVTLEKNSVRSTHIKNGQVKRVDLGRNAVNSSKVGDRSLLAQDFAAGQLPAGRQGEQGPKGDSGQPGSDLAAYAHINADGTLDATRSKNVISASKESAGPGGDGAYCLDLAVPPRLVVAASRGYAENKAVVNVVVQGDDGASTPCTDTGQDVFLQVVAAAGTPEAGQPVNRPVDVLIN